MGDSQTRRICKKVDIPNHNGAKLSSKRAPLFSDESIIFTIDAEEIIDETIISDWSEKIQSAINEEKTIEKVILDFSMKTSLNNKELNLIARNLGANSKEIEWRVYINCNKEIADLVKSQGLSKMIECNHAQTINLKTARILIVEDVLSLRKTLRGHLEDMGYIDIQEAENGLHGLEAIEKLKSQDGYFDLIFSDISMPEMDGIEFLKKVRQFKKLKKLKVIMVTSSGDTENVMKCIEYGPVSFIVKPVSAEVLKTKLGKL